MASEMEIVPKVDPLELEVGAGDSVGERVAGMRSNLTLAGAGGGSSRNLDQALEEGKVGSEHKELLQIQSEADELLFMQAQELERVRVVELSAEEHAQRYAEILSRYHQVAWQALDAFPGLRPQLESEISQLKDGYIQRYKDLLASFSFSDSQEEERVDELSEAYYRQLKEVALEFIKAGCDQEKLPVEYKIYENEELAADIALRAIALDEFGKIGEALFSEREA